MTTIVIMPGGFHPFHAGHYALYQSAQRTFPDAEVYVAATNDTSARPFPFPVKEKLAKLAGVEAGHFVQVKSPFKAEEITAKFDPARDTLIFVRSEKDSTKPPQPGGVKKDGSPSYLQPLLGAKKLEPFARHAYMAYLPTVEFGPGMTSATEIRTAWPQLDERRKTALVMSLYPRTQGNAKLAATVVGLLDAAIGTQGVAEGSIEQRIAQAKKNNPLRASVAKKTNGYAALVTDTTTGKTSWFGGALWQTPELAMGHAKAFVKGFPYLEQEYAQRFIDKNRNGIVGQGVAEGMAGMDDAEPYTIGRAVDKQYVYTVMRDGKSMGIYHSLDDAKSIVANNKRTNKYSEFKIMRKPRSKMAGPVGQLPEQGVAEDSEKNPHTSALGKALYRDLSKQPKLSSQQVQRNKERWAKRQAEREQGVAEGAPIVVAQAPIDVRNPKKDQPKQRYMGDIVPDTKPPSTEKRGVKGRPGQRPMPRYDENNDYLDE